MAGLRIIERRTPLGMEEWVWWNHALIPLHELRSLFRQNLRSPRMSMPPSAIGTGSGVIVFTAIRPGACGELRMPDNERLLRIKRSLEALYADQPIKLSPAEWKQIVEDLE
jgi:hypothetical protein